MNLASAKPALLWLLILWQAAPQSAGPASHFRYHRTVRLYSSPTSAQACAVLDANVFAHSAPSLRDLRLYGGQTEIPYATTLSEPLQQDTEDARILNLRSIAGHLLFDLEMPHRPYTGLTLDLAARDYIAKAAVSGSAAPNGRNVTALGTFTLFDLTSQHLFHSTDIPLSESTFPYLHIDLVLNQSPDSPSPSPPLDRPAIVRAVTVPPSREAQSLYTTTQRAVASQKGQASVASFSVQSRVPIERIAFALPSDYKGSFSRAVRIEARVNSQQEPKISTTADDLSGVEAMTGSILRVHKSEGGRELAAESLGIPVAIGSNMQQPALVEVTVEDGPEAPLPLTVELQMRQRRVCFDTAKAAAPLTLYYGDPSLDPPAYSDASLSQASANPSIALLEPEAQNSVFVAASPSRKFAQHRPILRWIALLGGVCIFALLVIRRTHHKRH